MGADGWLIAPAMTFYHRRGGKNLVRRAMSEVREYKRVASPRSTRFSVGRAG